MTSCPACGSSVLYERDSAAQIAAETALRSRFIQTRFDHRPEPAELMDLTEFMHGGPGRLLACSRCGLIVRDEATAAHYENDVCDPDLMTHLYPRYLDAFRQKEGQYSDLLPPGARVLELGSHLGAFLEAAEDWNWKPLGLDIGEYTSAFARSRGLTVRRQPIEDLTLHQRRAQAVFIWNCFEQLEKPFATLKHVHRLLEPHGVLVVRVPNAGFYEYWRRRLQRGPHAQALKRLGYNNLLGFPYLHGYQPNSLFRLLQRSGFRVVAEHNSSLITLPLPDMPDWVENDCSSVYSLSNGHDEVPAKIGGPWIEVVARMEA